MACRWPRAPSLLDRPDAARQLFSDVAHVEHGSAGLIPLVMTRGVTAGAGFLILRHACVVRYGRPLKTVSLVMIVTV
jgi:hypothetical protein